MRTRGLLLLLALVLAGCASAPDPAPPTGATPRPTPSGVASGDFTLAFAHATLNATPGHAVAFPLTLGHRGAGGRIDVHLAGQGVQGNVTGAQVPAEGNLTLFVAVDVPAGAAPGARLLTAVVRDAAGRELARREGAATVVVLGGAAGYAPGDRARVVYTGRLAETGLTFNTNDPALKSLGFARTADYSFNPSLLDVTSLPRPSVVAGFHEAVLGMLPGESRTVTFPAEKGYGNATAEERVPRRETLERRESLDLPEASLSAQEFSAFLDDTGQGRPEDFREGDLVVSERQGERLRYRIVNKSAEEVTLRLAVEVGERYTVHPSWPNGSEVEAVTETTAVFLTTPATPPGEGFTYFPYWPGMTFVERVDETSIVLRHDPPQGLHFSRTLSQFGPPEEATVLRVDEEEITLTSPSSHPLAGKALTFDVTLVELARGAGQG